MCGVFWWCYANSLQFWVEQWHLSTSLWSCLFKISLFINRAVRIAPFSNRLAHAVPPDVQGLRCLANFRALRFSDPIRTLAEKMVDRMIKSSSQSGGKYVSVHLRFEMVLFSLFPLVNKWCYIFGLLFIYSICQSLVYWRIWLHFHAASMMVERKKNVKWISLERKAGEENSGKGAE